MEKILGFLLTRERKFMSCIYAKGRLWPTKYSQIYFSNFNEEVVDRNYRNADNYYSD